MKFYDELKARGIIEAMSHDELEEKLNNDSLSFYCGYDPSAKSLQLGNLFTIVTCMRFQSAGHKPYMLVGGATGMIGDPSGKSEERNLLDEETLKSNIEGITKQLGQFVSFDQAQTNAAVMVNNHDWWGGIGFLEFLRTIGKRFRVSEMLAKDSVKSRIQSESGISLTEFSYQILQAYDFVCLNKKYNVKLQIGGSDQWGNMTAGTDLVRKMNSEQAFCFTMPLITDQNGKKYGKSEGNAIFLDAEMTSPYKMYQFLLNADDSIVDGLLKRYTFLSLDEIAALAEKTNSEPHLRSAQKTLASEVVKLVHGEEGLASALRATSFFFGEKIENVSDREISSIFEDVPSVTLSKDFLSDGDFLEVLALTPLFKSKGEARRSVEQNGISINNIKVSEVDKKLTSSDLASETALLVKKGKKNYCVIKFE